ncbi:RNA pyrophosphohydrolase [Acetobacteraceae bacterium]|nr:RNA pyrophosphohydrolase [Acetobacteraceae bacterium]
MTDISSFHSLPYRPNAGIALFNRKGELFLGRRVDHRQQIWQCPQGGIQENETPEQAAWREMAEEIGTNKAKYLGEREGWVTYELPARLYGKALGGRYRGQRQKWVVFAFLGEDKDINLEQFEYPEFSEWKWASPESILSDYNLGFKSKAYQEVFPDIVQIFNESGFGTENKQ